MLTKSKHKSISFELEGTNSAGDLGAAASVSFQHRNLFRGSETFMVKFRGAYEAISGLQPGYKTITILNTESKQALISPISCFLFSRLTLNDE